MHRSGCDGRCFLCIGFQSNILYKSLRYFHVIADVFCCFDRISKGWRSRSQSFHKLRVARFCLSLGKVFIPNFKYSLRQISSDRPVKMDPVLVQTCRYHLHEHNLRKLRNVSFGENVVVLCFRWTLLTCGCSSLTFSLPEAFLLQQVFVR